LLGVPEYKRRWCEASIVIVVNGIVSENASMTNAT
jgi:hypothetical protein